MDLFLFLALWCRGGPTLFSVGIMIAFKGLVASVRLLRCPEHPPPFISDVKTPPILPYITVHPALHWLLPGKSWVWVCGGWEAGSVWRRTRGGLQSAECRDEGVQDL